MATLLSYCKARDLLWDPRKDILYLCKHRTEEVQRIRRHLNNREVKELFLGTSFFSRLDLDAQRLCYQTLLDTQPPPIMSITPPASQVQTNLQSRPDELNREADVRPPRSRYRKATGPRSSSDSAADCQAQNHARTQSAEQFQDPRRLSYIEGVRYIKSAKPQTVLVTTATKNARNSMPNLTTGQHALQALYNNAQETNRSRPQEQTHKMPQTDQVYDRSPLIGQQPTHASSRLDYGADFRPAHMTIRHDAEGTNQSSQAGHKTPPGIEDPSEPAVHAMRSQKGSLHDAATPEREQVPSQQVSEDASTSQRGKLHLVGPAGVYGTAQKSTKTGHVQAEHQRHHSAPPPQTQPTFIFELEAGAPLESTFVAELPADSIVSSSAEQHISRDEAAKQHQGPIRPFTVGTSSAALGIVSLPASLVAGRPGTHARHESFNHSELAERESTLSTYQTNAFRYSSYAFPSSVAPRIPQEGAAAPTYKAYRPFVLTKELSRNDSVSSVYSPSHRRDASDDSAASHDSTKLAREYQELLDFEGGYGSC